MLDKRSSALAGRRVAVERGLADLQQNRIARGREYFFGLFDRKGLERLVDGLPAESDFRV